MKLPADLAAPSQGDAGDQGAESHDADDDGARVDGAQVDGARVAEGTGLERRESRCVTRRSMVGYLTLPRPPDLLTKGLLMPSGYVAGRLGAPSDGVAAGAAAVAWVVFECGLYQARYLVNDLIDFDSDQQHRAAGWRGRLPSHPRVRRQAVAGLAIRLALVGILVGLLPGDVQAVTAVAALGLVASTVCYEVSRTPARRRPVLADPPRLSWSLATVFGLVGSGYGLRFAFGMALAGAPAAVIAVAGAFAWVFGVMLVVALWILEGAWLRAAGDSATLARKPHLALLTRLVQGGRASPSRPLYAGAPARLVAGLFAVASTLAVAVGVLLAESPRAGEVGVLLVVWAAIGPLVVARRQSYAAGAVVVVLDAGAAVTLLMAGGEPAMVALAVIIAAPTAVTMPCLQVFLDRHPPPAPTLG